MSNYIIDPTLGFGPIPVPPQPTRNAWVEIGRTTLVAPASDITVAGLPKKRWLMVLMRSVGSSFDANMFLRFNGDSGNRYASRVQSNGGVDLATPNVSAILVGGDNDFDPDFGIAYIDNIPFGEKLVTAHDCEQGLPGTGLATQVPNRRESMGKYSPVDLSDQITTVTLTTNSGQSWNTGSEVIVLGFDPADALDDTFNFWQPLATSINSTTIMTATFAAKKYLWFELFFKLATGLYRMKVRYNGDGTSVYNFRESTDGAADTTTVTRDGIILGTNSGNLIRHNDMFIVNEAIREKLAIHHFEGSLANSPGTGTTREEMVSKWTNKIAQITTIDIINDAAPAPTLDPFQSFFKVWGHD